MGCGPSRQAYAAGSGTEAEYKAAFDEKKVLGQGEFGVVKLVAKTAEPDDAELAVKVLNKGFVFKDNTLYTPMKPEILQMEINILRELDGKNFNLSMDSVYESSSKVYLVTEVCAGGEMMEYTSTNMSEGLRTEDVSRIAYQLLSAVAHCERHDVLHRDIKPDNIMFKANTKTAELRLIDFGCATMDKEKGKEHSTFAGTPFYISPEVFQRRYTTKADVFSAGVVLYVLVAGYPAECLQAAFNLLHKVKRDLKTLPGMPEHLPDTYYEMLDKMLTYRWKGRASAAEMLEDEFVVFHQAIEGLGVRSVVLSGTGEKAAISFAFAQFSRSVTAILATTMDRGGILSIISFAESYSLDRKLGVIKVKNLKLILSSMGKHDVVSAIEQQKNAQAYNDYPYEYTLLQPFSQKPSYYGGNYYDADGSSKSIRSTSRSTRSAVKMVTGDTSAVLCASDRVMRNRRRRYV